VCACARASPTQAERCAAQMGVCARTALAGPTCGSGLGGSRPWKLGGSTFWMRSQYDSRTSRDSVASTKRLRGLRGRRVGRGAV